VLWTLVGKELLTNLLTLRLIVATWIWTSSGSR